MHSDTFYIRRTPSAIVSATVATLDSSLQTNDPEAILQSKQLSVASYPDDIGTLLITIQSGTISSAQ
jgi:hypothetical protein